ncbi:MAG: NAD-dependent epimerase/dehydratase family protein [Alphaproteobacteria bacterium]|nr:NAD-dependent epimerase/dehydratase family protein [Alphaproteobacteria bacterium]
MANTIFVAGSNGMVGSAIVRRLKMDGVRNIVAPTRKELDLTNQQAVNDFFKQHQFREVYLAAARVGGIHANNTYPAEFIYQNLMMQANVIEAGGAGTAPMIWSGGMAWIADFPDPSNFYGPILGCAGAGEGGWNWSKFCDESLDAMAVEADSISDPARSDERLKLWSDVYMGVMEKAPWVPVFNEERYTMKSERMAGDDALYVDPVSIPVNYDYVWVKQ